MGQLPKLAKALPAKSFYKSLHKFLRQQEVSFVRLLWCDNASMIRAKAFHRQLLKTSGKTSEGVAIGISAAQQAISALYDAVVPDSGLGPVGEVWLEPDWSTLAVLPYAAGQARVLGNLTQQQQPWALCPRSMLQRQIQAAAELDLEIKAAFEPEFYLLRSTPSGFEPADRTGFAATLSMDLQHRVINDIAAALLAQSIPVERYYAEAGPGQQEISIGYTHALAAADRQIIYRETVQGVALQHGLRASFLPKIFADQAGSGCHLHTSLWQAGENITFDRLQPGQLSPIARAFVAGILQHLPALMAITTPSPNSYRRLQPHCWSGAYRCWGYDNREAAVRIPSNPLLPSPTHIELKTSDATANPYLALGATIAAGLDGIRRSLDPGLPVSHDPGDGGDAERLPDNLGAAIDQLSQNPVLRDALGPELSQAFLAVRRAEWQALKDASLAEEVEKLIDRF